MPQFRTNELKRAFRDLGVVGYRVLITWVTIVSEDRVPRSRVESLLKANGEGRRFWEYARIEVGPPVLGTQYGAYAYLYAVTACYIQNALEWLIGLLVNRRQAYCELPWDRR